MAIDIYTQYDPRANVPNAAYPTGSIKDETIPGVSNDGTPLTAVWGNDYVGFTDALLAEAGIAHSGNADTATNSQRLEAILTLISNSLKMLPVAGGSTLTANRKHLLLDDTSPFVLPDTTGLANGSFVELTRVSGNVNPVINVDGTNSETISQFRSVDGTLREGPDTSIRMITFSTIRLVLVSGNWEL